MNDNTKKILYGFGIIVVLYFLYKYLTKNESFSVDGAINGSVPLGGIVNNTYDIVQPDINTFADIVAPSMPMTGGSCNKLPLPMKAGLDNDYRDLLPDVNTHAASYDIDVSDPQVFQYRPSIRSTIHNRQQIGADQLRGDIPIIKSSNSNSNQGWFTSRYGEGDIKTDAYFSSFGEEKFRSLTGQKSYPSFVANEELILDGNFMNHPVQKADELSMDWY